MPQILAVLLFIGAAGHIEQPVKALVELTAQGMVFITNAAAP